MMPKISICICTCGCKITVIKPDKAPVRCWLCKQGEHPPQSQRPIGKAF